MLFEFGTANRIIFGAGAIERVGRLAADLGQRALVVTGRSPERADVLVQQLKKHDVRVSRFSVTGEPTLIMLTEGLSQARGHGADVVIGFGGGSVIDTGKALAALVNNPSDEIGTSGPEGQQHADQSGFSDRLRAGGGLGRRHHSEGG